MNLLSTATLGATLGLAALSTAATAQGVDPRGRAILFVRGAFGTGGATEGGTPSQRTEQLSDVFDLNTNTRNHSYGTLRNNLLADGFTVDQRVESATPVTVADLQPYRIVVWGSNNRTYSAAEVQAFHAYIDLGGSALFISDANWGLTWDAAPASDNQFLGRYGVQVYQDSGQLPSMARSTPGRYLLPDHPVLSGPDGAGAADDVNSYNGEGVSLFRITTGSQGYQAIRVVDSSGLQVRLNNPSGGAGMTRPATATDAAMVCVEKGDSRILGHFDRNTFFNRNGAGTDLHTQDNSRLALNLFRYLAGVPAAATAVGTGCGTGSGPKLQVTRPILARTTTFTLSGAAGTSPGWVVFSPTSKTVSFGNGCSTYLDLATAQPILALTTDGAGGWSTGFLMPAGHPFSGIRATAQALILRAGGPFLGDGELSNGVELRAGDGR